jgi:biotin carboxylase
VLARRVDGPDELRRFLAHPSVRRFERKYLNRFKRLVRSYADFQTNGEFFLAEQLLHGKQATVEGFAFQGEITITGIVDSVMYPGTISFSSFEYPSTLPIDAQHRMQDIARRVIAHSGFDNGIFNVEMFYDAGSDTIRIIEVNPRMVGQFADLMEKVDGTNTYEVLLAIAAGERPRFKRASGPYRIAASFALRSFEDRTVISVPSPATIRAIRRRFPDTLVQVFCDPGDRLSSYEHMNDMQSYCYAMVNMGALDREALLGGFAEVRERLGFRFEKRKRGRATNFTNPGTN